MPDIIEFLRARYDEDEQIALDAYGARWEVGPTFGALNNRVYVREEGDPIDSVGTCVIAGQVANVPQFRDNAQHIARWDPARVLAEVEAKRQVIDHAELWAATLHETPEGWTEAATTAYRMAMAWTLNLLAATYADHPDYAQI